jgi:hypothetical protein
MRLGGTVRRPASRLAGGRLARRVRPGPKRLSVRGLADLRKTLLRPAKGRFEQRRTAPVSLRRTEPANGWIQFKNPLAERQLPLSCLIGGVEPQGAAKGPARGRVLIFGKLDRSQPGVRFRIAIVFARQATEYVRRLSRCSVIEQ